MLITVIIPIYNTASYLLRCINSITSQDLDDVELIFIDDCSTDDSFEKLNTILNGRTDINYRILQNKSNLGSGETRNIGIKEACGDYVIFIDSDDYIETNYFIELKNIIKNELSDIVIFDYTEIYKDTTVYKQCKTTDTKEKIIANLIESKMHNSLCNKLIKRSLFIDNNIFIQKGMSMFEDKSICFKLFENANLVSYIPKSLYYYDRTRDNSLTRQNQAKNISNALILLEIIDNHYKDKNVTPLLQNSIFNNKILITGLISLYSDYHLRRDFIKKIGAINFTAFFNRTSMPIHYKISAFCFYYNLKFLLVGLRKLYFSLR